MKLKYILFLLIVIGIICCKKKAKVAAPEVLHIQEEALMFFPMKEKALNLQDLSFIDISKLNENQDITKDSRFSWIFHPKKYNTIWHNGYYYSTSASIYPNIKKSAFLQDSLTTNEDNFFVKQNDGVIWIHQIPNETFTDIIKYDSALHEKWHTIVETLDSMNKKTMFVQAITSSNILFSNDKKSALINTNNGSKKNLEIGKNGIVTDLDGNTIVGMLKKDSSGYITSTTYFAEDKQLYISNKKYTHGVTSSNNSQYFVALYNLDNSNILLQVYDVFTNQLFWEIPIDVKESISEIVLLSYSKKIILEARLKNKKSLFVLDALSAKILFEQNF
jgi:hypothetical protein